MSQSITPSWYSQLSANAGKLFSARNLEAFGSRVHQIGTQAMSYLAPLASHLSEQLRYIVDGENPLKAPQSSLLPLYTTSSEPRGVAAAAALSTSPDLEIGLGAGSSSSEEQAPQKASFSAQNLCFQAFQGMQNYFSEGFSQYSAIINGGKPIQPAEISDPLDGMEKGNPRKATALSDNNGWSNFLKHFSQENLLKLQGKAHEMAMKILKGAKDMTNTVCLPSSMPTNSATSSQPLNGLSGKGDLADSSSMPASYAASPILPRTSSASASAASTTTQPLSPLSPITRGQRINGRQSLKVSRQQREEIH